MLNQESGNTSLFECVHLCAHDPDCVNHTMGENCTLITASVLNGQQRWERRRNITTQPLTHIKVKDTTVHPMTNSRQRNFGGASCTRVIAV